MKLTEIKGMFAPGQTWKVTREGNKPLVIHGNLGQTVMPALNGEELRQVVSAKSQLVWIRDGRTVYAEWPKASEVIEAKENYLRFKYDNGTIITCEKQIN